MNDDQTFRMIAVMIFCVLGLVAVFRYWTVQEELNHIYRVCTVYEDGSAECPDSTFDWEG